MSGGPPDEPAGPRLRTERLLLRRWRPEDREPFADLCADPWTMRFFPSPLTRAESDAMVDRIEQRFEVDGFGLWAVEVPDAAPFIGFVGLLPVLFTAPFTPAVEVGWRLSRTHWGRGYATEAARSALGFAFDVLGLDEVVSFTAAVNEPSRAVMARLGMHRDPGDDFVHPGIAANHRLQPHVLYRLGRGEWEDRVRSPSPDRAGNRPGTLRSCPPRTRHGRTTGEPAAAGPPGPG